VSDGYTKLFSSILDSTVWMQASHIRLVWVTMLAMKGHDGIVEASVPGLAKRAGVTMQECEEALQCFLSPDPHSRTRDHDGRRIAEVDGGWEVLNHPKYKHKASAGDIREQTAARMRALRDRKRNAVTERHSPSPSVTVTQSDASYDIRSESDKIRTDSDKNLSETQTRATASPTRTRPDAVDRLPEPKQAESGFTDRRMQAVFVREYEAVQRSTPSMAGKLVGGLHAMVSRTAELQGVDPEVLFTDSVRAWLSNALTERDRQSPYACFCQAWGALTARGQAKPSDGSAETVESLQAAARAAVLRGDHAEAARLGKRRDELRDAADRQVRRGK
jgi:hypothetical protein